MQSIDILTDSDFVGERLDKYLQHIFPAFSRAALQKAIDAGSATVNGKSVSKNYKLRAGDKLVFTPLEARPLEVMPQNIPLEIVYEDGDLLVVNKPKGMVVHPAPGNPDGTLVNALLYHCGDSLSGINGVLRPGIVHRIDKDTSGLLIVAKNDFAHRMLSEQIAEHSFTREYRAVITGRLKTDSGTVNAPIGRDTRGNGQNPPNPRAHGVSRASLGGRHGLRAPEKKRTFPRRSMPARGENRVCASAHRRVFGI